MHYILITAGLITKTMQNYDNVKFERKRDLTEVYDRILYTNGKLKNKVTTQKRHLNVRLHTDCGPT